MDNLTIRKLRIYAILMRFKEIGQERKQAILSETIRRMRVFEPAPIRIMDIREIMPKDVISYDKKGKILENPKSKFHK